MFKLTRTRGKELVPHLTHRMNGITRSPKLTPHRRERGGEREEALPNANPFRSSMKVIVDVRDNEKYDKKGILSLRIDCAN